MAEQYQPDVIFLDIAMPKLDGYEVATRIRNQPWGKKIFLVALTGLSGEEDRQQSRKVGFNKHIAKPVAREKISCILDSYLRQDVARSGN
jgi:CheY-like chemotaxis protein